MSHLTRFISGSPRLFRAIGLAPLVLLTAFVSFAAGAASIESPTSSVQPLDFQRDVRPILAGHCFKCHGPDEAARKAKLRLDVRDGAIGPAKSGKSAITPGNPDSSPLVRRIFSTDDNEVMPPPETKHPLSTSQKETLKRWIADGAEYTAHWAFIPPKARARPMVKQQNWARNEIDYFILARLEKEGLPPSARADKHTLARRVYLDLIGLPPTIEQADAFVSDDSAEAYDRLVDRLLSSPHYGERWARRWLDLARYADTNGYEKDRRRSIWPYRDWVIQAINADMPFDQFTIEQIAGDMLPDPTPQQLIATGFHRNTMLNEEGGIDPLEFRFYAMVDRANTTATTWLGLTMGCAQCHTHKYDPIQHSDYYKFMAFLDNADEPEIEVDDPDVSVRRDQIKEKLAKFTAELANRFPLPADDAHQNETRRKEYLEQKFQAWWTEQRERAVRWTALRPTHATSNLPLLTVLEDDSILASGDQTKSDTYELEFRSDLKGITALRIEALPDAGLPNHGPGRVYYEGPIGDFTLSELSVSSTGKLENFKSASQSFASGQFTAAAAIDGNPQTGWSVNGGQGREHSAVFNFATPVDGGDLTVKMLFERHFAAGLGRFRISATVASDKVAAVNMPRDVEELLSKRPSEINGKQRERLLSYYLSVAPELAEARKETDNLRKQLPAFPTTLVMKERPSENIRHTYIRKRGEFLQPLDRVEPDVLSALHPLPEGAPRNRLTFARWLVDPRNPLVGRVVMNREWSAFFGTGLVKTVQDFGFQGDLPSHPDLLDWLALEFVKQGWSLKKMHRVIVTSATYQQSSRVTPALLERDPQNRLLARGPRVRLEAELIRDLALSVTRLMSPKVGGPSVFPPQPPGVTTEGAYGPLEWKVSEGGDRYRRGLYTFAKRTAPYAMFATFDGPSGEACVARRDVSNTPLQSLTLLNNPVLIEAAQALGRMIDQQSGTDEARLVSLFRHCLTRPPQPEELSMLLQFFLKQKQRFAQRELEPSAVSGLGGDDRASCAAWTSVARAVLNLDETFTKN
jgi:hypothetical protein